MDLYSKPISSEAIEAGADVLRRAIGEEGRDYRPLASAVFCAIQVTGALQQPEIDLMPSASGWSVEANGS